MSSALLTYYIIALCERVCILNILMTCSNNKGSSNQKKDRKKDVHEAGLARAGTSSGGSPVQTFYYGAPIFFLYLNSIELLFSTQESLTIPPYRK